MLSIGCQIHGQRPFPLLIATLWAGALTDASMNAMRLSALRTRAARAGATARVRGLVTAMRRACPCAAVRDPSQTARRGARAPGHGPAPSCRAVRPRQIGRAHV